VKAKLRGTEIYFDVAGMQIAPDGKDFIERPVLFLLHGGPGGNHLRYKLHSIELEKVAQLVFVDHRGCGLSKVTKASDYTCRNNVDDLEALRKHLGLNKICILGTSYGGMVAQGYAIRYPKNVEKLVLAATAPSYRFLHEAKLYLKKHGTEAQIEAADAMWAGKMTSEKKLAHFFKIMDPLYSVSRDNKYQAYYSKLKSHWSRDALNQGVHGFMRHFDFIPQLKKITAPTLVLAGDKDWICRPSQSRIIAEHIPHATLKVFKNCGHTIAVDAHEQYIKVVSRFLKE
jgi:proline iminopeptidase